MYVGKNFTRELKACLLLVCELTAFCIRRFLNRKAIHSSCQVSVGKS